jgi:hypothetical protein
MEVKTLEHFLYNNDLNNSMKITYNHEDNDRTLENSIFEHCEIKQNVRCLINNGYESEYIYSSGYFVLYRWPEDNYEPYFMCQVIRLQEYSTWTGMKKNRAVLRKLKPYLILTLIYKDKDGNDHEKRIYKYYKGVYEDSILLYIDSDGDGSKYEFYNINKYMIFNPSYCDY